MAHNSTGAATSPAWLSASTFSSRRWKKVGLTVIFSEPVKAVCLFTSPSGEARHCVVQFVTTQWRASPEGDVNKQTAFTGSEKITVNPTFFQRLDEKVDALNHAGLVAAPVLLWAIAGGGNSKVNPGNSLPDDQATLLARYMVARWSGSAVAYL